MTTLTNVIEQIAYASATTEVLCGLNGRDECLAAYYAFNESLDNGGGVPDHLVVHDDYCDDDPEDVMDVIVEKAGELMGMFKEVLELAKEGICRGAIDGSLPNNYYDLDMNQLANDGASPEETDDDE